MKRKYKITFNCRNCGKYFAKEIPVGVEVKIRARGVMCYRYTDGYYDLNGKPHDNCNLDCYIECPKCQSDNITKTIVQGT